MQKPEEFFNRHLDTDIIAVLDASAALEVTEFRLFQLAFTDWHGKPARADYMERQFAAYMFAQRVPTWVRHFSRKIIKLQSQGLLDPKVFGIWKPLPSRRMVLIAKFYSAALLLVFLLAMISVYALPQNVLSMFAGCYFPPCY